MRIVRPYCQSAIQPVNWSLVVRKDDLNSNLDSMDVVISGVALLLGLSRRLGLFLSERGTERRGKSAGRWD